MQVLNVSVVHRIGGLSHICVGTEKQHGISNRTDQASLPPDSGWHGGGSKMKGDSVGRLSTSSPFRCATCLRWDLNIH